MIRLGGNNQYKISSFQHQTTANGDKMIKQIIVVTNNKPFICNKSVCTLLEWRKYLYNAAIHKAITLIEHSEYDFLDAPNA